MHGDVLRLALVGAGAIAQTYAAALQMTPQARLVAVVDVHGERARAIADAAACEAFDSLDACLRSAAPDAAVVCVPPSLHAPVAQRLLRAGVHVLCEKPFALDCREATAMLDCARHNSRLLIMASKFRHVPDVARAKALLQSGVLGDIVEYEGVFTSRVDMSRRWNSDPTLSGGGVTIDNGCHAVDLLRFLVGPVRDVSAVEARRIAGLRVDETAQLTCRTGDGVIGHIELSWSVHRDVDYYVRIAGSQGVMSIGWKESRYRVEGSRDWIVFGSGYDKLQAFAAQLRNFTGAVLGTESTLIAASDAFASVAVVEAAYASMRTGFRTPVSELLGPTVARAA